MKLKYLSFLILVISAFNTFGQTSQLKLSEVIQKKRNVVDFGIVDENDKYYYQLSSKNAILNTNYDNFLSEVAVTAYDADLNLITTQEFERFEFGSRNSIKFCWEYFAKDASGNLYYYHSEFHDKKNVYLWRTNLNKETLELENEQVIAKFKVPKKNYNPKATFAVFNSPDQSKHAVVSFSKHPTDQYLSSVYIEVFDNTDMRSIWKTNTTIDIYVYENFAKIINLQELNNLSLTRGKSQISLSNEGTLHALLNM